MFLQKVKKVVGETGVAVYNVCAHPESMYVVFEKQFKGVFKNVWMENSEDNNRVLIATDRPILQGEDMEKERKDWMKSYLIWSVCLSESHLIYELYSWCSLLRRTMIHSCPQGEIAPRCLL